MMLQRLFCYFYAGEITLRFICSFLNTMFLKGLHLIITAFIAMRFTIIYKMIHVKITMTHVKMTMTLVKMTMTFVKMTMTRVKMTMTLVKITMTLVKMTMTLVKMTMTLPQTTMTRLNGLNVLGVVIPLCKL